MSLFREIKISYATGSSFLFPVVFYTLVILIAVISIGPHPNTLNNIGPGILWIGMLLASLMASEQLFINEYEQGIFEQMRFSKRSFSWLIMQKVLAFWLVNIFPMLIITPLLAQWLYLSFDKLIIILASLCLGSLSLTLISAIGSALSLSVKKRNLLLILIIIPLYVPILIFSIMMIDSIDNGANPLAYMAISLAFFISLSIITPFILKFAIKINL